MTSFHAKPFSERLSLMGDTCEQKFEEHCTSLGHPFYRIGFNRPPFSFTAWKKVPKYLRHMPDYMVEVYANPTFVECKGFGRRPLKFKVETIDALNRWAEDLFVSVFVYDQEKDRSYWVEWTTFREELLNPEKELKQFHNDKKYYYEVTRDELEMLGKNE